LKNRQVETRYVDQIIYQTIEREVPQFVESVDESRIKALIEENGNLQIRLMEFVKQAQILANRQPEIRIVERPVIKVVERVVTEIETCLKVHDNRVEQLKQQNASLNVRLMELNKESERLRNGDRDVVVKLIEKISIDEEKIRAMIGENGRLQVIYAERVSELDKLKIRLAEIRYVEKYVVQLVERIFID
jgi:hypothetical protein